MRPSAWSCRSPPTGSCRASGSPRSSRRATRREWRGCRRVSLDQSQGLYQHSPALAVCFLLTGLACVGFPGTLGFISTELLVDSAVEVSPYVGVAVVAAGAPHR